MEYFIKKGISILLEIILGNIEKEKLKAKGLGILKDSTTTIYTLSTSA